MRTQRFSRFVLPGISLILAGAFVCTGLVPLTADIAASPQRVQLENQIGRDTQSFKNNNRLCLQNGCWPAVRKFETLGAELLRDPLNANWKTWKEYQMLKRNLEKYRQAPDKDPGRIPLGRSTSFEDFPVKDYKLFVYMQTNKGGTAGMFAWAPGTGFGQFFSLQDGKWSSVASDQELKAMTGKTSAELADYYKTLPLPASEEYGDARNSDKIEDDLRLRPDKEPGKDFTGDPLNRGFYESAEVFEKFLTQAKTSTDQATLIAEYKALIASIPQDDSTKKTSVDKAQGILNTMIAILNNDLFKGDNNAGLRQSLIDDATKVRFSRDPDEQPQTFARYNPFDLSDPNLMMVVPAENEDYPKEIALRLSMINRKIIASEEAEQLIRFMRIYLDRVPGGYSFLIAQFAKTTFKVGGKYTSFMMPDNKSIRTTALDGPYTDGERVLLSRMGPKMLPSHAKYLKNNLDEGYYRFTGWSFHFISNATGGGRWQMKPALQTDGMSWFRQSYQDYDWKWMELTEKEVDSAILYMDKTIPYVSSDIQLIQEFKRKLLEINSRYSF